MNRCGRLAVGKGSAGGGATGERGASRERRGSVGRWWGKINRVPRLSSCRGRARRIFSSFPWVPNVARRAAGASEAAETLGAAGGGGG